MRPAIGARRSGSSSEWCRCVPRTGSRTPGGLNIGGHRGFHNGFTAWHPCQQVTVRHARPALIRSERVAECDFPPVVAMPSWRWSNSLRVQNQAAPAAAQQRPVTLAEIAQAQHLSLAYLEQLFGPLRRAGLVASARGPGGGYRLARAGRRRSPSRRSSTRWTSRSAPPAARKARRLPRRAALPDARPLGRTRRADPAVPGARDPGRCGRRQGCIGRAAVPRAAPSAESEAELLDVFGGGCP